MKLSELPTTWEVTGLTLPPAGTHIPEPPEDAPREQLFEFAALAGFSRWDSVSYRVAAAYCQQWHPELLDADAENLDLDPPQA